MRLLVVTSLLALAVPALAEPNPQADTSPGTLVLTPRTNKGARAGVEVFTRGLAQAVEAQGAAAMLDADLAAVTPGDIVARCPARISARCLAQAASKTGAGRTLTGVLEQQGPGYRARLRVVDAASAEIFAVRDLVLVPARGDTLDLEIAGRCLGRDALASAAGRDSLLTEAPCGDRVFVTSQGDREHYAGQLEATPEALWITVLPGAEERAEYIEKNGVLAGAFASATAIAVVGVATAVLLAVQTSLTQGEARDLALDNPQAFHVAEATVTVDDEFDASVARYRELESRGRLESFASLAAGFGAAISALTGAALYGMADVPGRYDAYLLTTAGSDIQIDAEAVE